MNTNIHKKTLAILFILSMAFLYPINAQESKKHKEQQNAKTQIKKIRSYTVVVDPGHGGAPSKRKVDKWDPITRKFLGKYLYGGIYKNLHEHKVMLPLAKRLHYYLGLTKTDKGWEKFSNLLSQFSNKKKHTRIILTPKLTRTTSYSHFKYSKKDPRNHEPYLLYDYKSKNDHRIKKGRLSQINQWQPHLVVSLHTTPAGKRQLGGMGAVLSPGYSTFHTIKKISLGRLSKSHFKKMPWFRGWLVTDRGWSKYEAARSDAWVYFHGFKTAKGKRLRIWRAKNRGLRYNFVQWKYADPPGWEKLARLNEPGPYATRHHKFKATGKFWDRERSQPERWRREGGKKGYGGDNHLASDELLRYVQHGARLLVPTLRKKRAMGPIVKPFVSTYSLPTFTNAIVAYLEIGHHNRKRDRRLVIKHREQVAKSLAVGIYSLFEGLQLKKQYGPYKPRSQKLNFSRYENLKEGNYFKVAKKQTKHN